MEAIEKGSDHAVASRVDMSGSFIGDTPGSLIPIRKKPMAVATKMVAEKALASKIKRRSMKTLNRRPMSALNRAENRNTDPVVLPRMQTSTGHARPTISSRAAARGVQRGGVNSVRGTMQASSKPGLTANNRILARGNAVSSQASNRLPFRANNMVKAAAVEAAKKTKPPPFVSRREQQLQKRVEFLENQNTELSQAVGINSEEKNAIQMQLAELSDRSQHDASALRALQAIHAEVSDQLRQKQQLLEQIQVQFDNATCNLTAAYTELSKVKDQLRLSEKERSTLKDKLWRSESEQRQLRNQVLELKGNIRVFCRVRPALSNEFGVPKPIGTIIFAEDTDRKMDILKSLEHGTAAKNSVASNGMMKHSFEFDKVFRPGSTQMEVFEEISHLVQSAIDGYNVCVFAYGQTGSGKTFTMEGPPSERAFNYPEPFGIIELSAMKIFEAIRGMETEGWEYTVEASFVEIYNETVLDLLTKDPARYTNEKLEIKMSNEGNGSIVDVAGLTKYNVTSVDEFKPLLEIAQQNRTIAGTKCNERSSRSHSVFRLRLIGTHAVRGVVLDGMVNLVDLAGSECIKKSESEGMQLKEAKNINRSLMTLGKVFMALLNGNTHIPYRESKLTYLLQNSLGGNSRTLMFVNISPEMDCINESLNSLRFATQVNQCHLGTATKNVSMKRAN